MICLREPSLDPVFGIKGGAAGGGWAQIVPMEDLNLHFTGDFAAIASANNLLAALRTVTVGLGGPINGSPRADGFDIVVALEVMAIFCLATSIEYLKKRLGEIVVSYTYGHLPEFAKDLKAHGAMTVLLKDALAPNLVQTLENNPVFVHGGPFANIAHGCNSVIAT